MISQFLWIRNLGAVQFSISDLQYPMKLQSSRWLELQSLRGLAFPLTWSQSFVIWAFPQEYLTTRQLASLGWETQRDRDSDRKQVLLKQKVKLQNLISESTSYYFHHFLFIIIKSLNPTHSEGEEITQGREYQEVEIVGAMLKNDFPSNDDNTVKGQGAKYSRNGKQSEVTRHVTRIWRVLILLKSLILWSYWRNVENIYKNTMVRGTF